VRIIKVSILRAHSTELVVQGDGIRVRLLSLGEAPVAIRLLSPRTDGRVGEDVLRKAFPGSGAVEGPDQHALVATLDEGDVAPHAAAGPVEFEPGAEQVGLAAEVFISISIYVFGWIVLLRKREFK